MSAWLTLQEYSSARGVSISTLRRKIKRRKIEYILQNGRYLLKVPPESSFSKEELKAHYQEILSQKEEEARKLKEEREDLLCLLNFLEREKEAWLDGLKNQEDFSPEP